MFLTFQMASGYHITVDSGRVAIYDPDMMDEHEYFKLFEADADILAINAAQVVCIRQATKEEREAAEIHGWGQKRKE